MKPVMWINMPLSSGNVVSCTLATLVTTIGTE